MRRLAGLGVAALMVLGTACSAGHDDEGDQPLFCQRLDRLTRNDPFLGFGDVASADDIEVAFAALTRRADELVDVAPPEARAAARDYAEAAAGLDALLTQADYDPSQVDVRAYRNEQVSYAQAADRLERYLKAEC